MTLHIKDSTNDVKCKFIQMTLKVRIIIANIYIMYVNLKGLCLISVMSKFDFLDPGRGNHGELHGNRRKVHGEYLCKCAGDNCMCARFYSIKYICSYRE